MPHDVDGYKLEVGDTVILMCQIKSIDSQKDDGCNITLKVENITKDEIYLPVIVCNSRLTQKLSIHSDEEIAELENEQAIDDFVKDLYQKQKDHEKSCNCNVIFVDCPRFNVKYEEYDLSDEKYIKDQNTCSKCGYGYVCCECNG